MTHDWYEAPSGAIAQGEIFRNCPVFRVLVPEGDEAEVVQEDHDVIVLTQSCDLENSKVEDVLVARVLNYVDLVAREGDEKQHLRSKKFREAAVENSLLPYVLLPEWEGPPAISWSLVDFHNLFSVPKVLLDGIASTAQRLQLRVPYREHLAQSFARYMMRVGLPNPPVGFRTVAV